MITGVYMEIKKMPEFQITLSEDTAQILFGLGQKMRIPPELSQDETLELIIDALANSLDTQMDIATTNVGNPIAMQEAIDAILNPDISTDFVQPETEPMIRDVFDFKKLFEMGGTQGKEVDDPVMRKTLVFVYEKLPRDEWGSSEAQRMVDQTYPIMLKAVQEHNE